MCSKASAVNLVCDIVLRKYVFTRLKADTFLSHSHVMTGRVEKILKHSVMLGYIPESLSFKVAATLAGTVLGSLTFLLMPAALRERQIGTVLLFLGHHCQIEFKFQLVDQMVNQFYILKFLTVFRKTVETVWICA